jgi:hypothetical protein
LHSTKRALDIPAATACPRGAKCRQDGAVLWETLTTPRGMEIATQLPRRLQELNARSNMSTVSSASLPKILFRGADIMDRAVKLSDIPGSAEGAERMLDSIVKQVQQQQRRVELATARIPNEEANVARVQSIIDNLDRVMPWERRAWQDGLIDAKNGVQSAKDEFELASKAQMSFPEQQLRMEKLISGLLGISLEQTQSMVAKRLDKTA